MLGFIVDLYVWMKVRLKDAQKFNCNHNQRSCEQKLEGNMIVFVHS